MAKIRSITIKFEPDTEVSPTTLRTLRKKLLRVRDWCEWAGIIGATVEMDVEVDDE